MTSFRLRMMEDMQVRNLSRHTGPLPEFLADDEDQESASDDDRPQLDAAE